MQLRGKKVLVFGAAKSGISATRLLQKLETNVILYDSNTKLKVEDFKDKLDTKDNFQLLTGELTENIINTLDLVILSPGVPIDLVEVKVIKEKNIPIWGEIELAYRNAKGTIIGITGTNGKTTTTYLVGEIMSAYFNDVYVVGNIGNPFTDIALYTTDDSVIIAEISSFQLETIDEFKPEISTILNISQDHLNRHHTMETYIAMKENIAKKQTSKELCILNYEDEILRQIADRLNTKIMYFSSERRLDKGLFLENGTIYYKDEEKEQKVCDIRDLKILGKHNYENVMAAVGIALSAGVAMDTIKEAVRSFQAVEHRIEFVETIAGVTYYNDSKGTNPDASIKAVQAMISPTILIAGGYDKGLEFDQWIKSFDKKIKCLILLGQTREKIGDTAKKYGFDNIVMVNSLEEAVKVSAKKAVHGDAVLLSPACASWGMFDNYEQRGQLFKEYVRGMVD
ncbi:MAG TPA: UDP-N-acetylmuramoyl-L-alanine--D-glutamate ligase [Clostridiales bacterium]|nr:UDP-N-acetylmuramoyl-L-alanine--D-glutamate ligase [Clostridiales bacterium]